VQALAARADGLGVSHAEKSSLCVSATWRDIQNCRSQGCGVEPESDIAGAIRHPFAFCLVSGLAMVDQARWMVAQRVVTDHQAGGQS
jgi:hypothetical protein